MNNVTSVLLSLLGTAIFLYVLYHVVRGAVREELREFRRESAGNCRCAAQTDDS